MGAVTKPRFAIVFLMVLTLGLFVGFAAEDIPETAYDESDAVPYEGTLSSQPRSRGWLPGQLRTG